MVPSSKEGSDVVKGYGNGANSCVQKPVDFEQLRVAVRQPGPCWLATNQPPPDAAYFRS